jgi:hypothetical protein
VPVANGTEPMEAVITADVLRRAGAEVAVASVEPGATAVAASWGVKLAADALIVDLADAEFDLISLPVSTLPLLCSALLAFQYLDVLFSFMSEVPVHFSCLGEFPFTYGDGNLSSSDWIG